LRGSTNRFDEVNRRITEGREETNHRFDRVEGDIRELKKSVTAIHATLTRVGVGVGLTFASVLLTKAF
jgi:chromosome segregation ATPase